ncbi:NAD(+) diphosphatase [Flammeovirgaceae bacterium SG7u.111]|nr:NAD(+) diphosphatase [Flammeovirgaceae bacterium SG7u.132]WPO33032.1 NAD(+) diphosphatase [Flammeovirgaceae bacterium SG7u.111]
MGILTSPFSFTPGANPTVGLPDLYFVFFQGKLLVEEVKKQPRVLFSRDKFEKIKQEIINEEYLGLLNESNCYVVELHEASEEIPSNWAFLPIRELFGKIPDESALLCGRANHMLFWAGRHKFCGKCGTRTRRKEDEVAKECPKCGSVHYPSIYPAIIVAITRGNQILLAHANRFNRRFYSVLAGFVEMGETLEECVAREVMEEVGIKVKNVKYFGSQPWPFPNSLMLGFTAEYASGEIKVDPVELTDADWYTPENMPPVPPPISIAGKLIQWFLDGKK